MAEYIDREALLLHIDCHGTNKFGMLDEDIRAFVKSQPAADVAPVVRCRDCKYFNKAVPNDKGFCICPASNMEIVPDDFCSYGEREG